MLRIAICDDKKEHIEIIRSAAEKYFATRNDSATEIDTFCTALDFLDAQAELVYDLVLLDICMPGLLGTDVAREIRQRKDKTEIVFLTTSDDFAVDAFQVKAAHYLLKPFSQMQFDEAVDRALYNIDKSIPKLLTLKCAGGGMEIIDKDDIYYIESAAHKQNIVLANGKTIEIVHSLAELMNMLNGLGKGQFINPYKGYIVNQKAIGTIECGKIVLKSGKEIPLPRGKFKEVKQAYFDYMFVGRL